MDLLTSDRPCFETDRFIVVLLSPSDSRRLMEFLLQDKLLAARIPWLSDKTREGALDEAFGIGLQAAAGLVRVWSIISRERQIQIGAMLVRKSREGLDIEALVASRYWDHDVVDEASEPLMDWLEENAGIIESIPRVLH